MLLRIVSKSKSNRKSFAHKDGKMCRYKAAPQPKKCLRVAARICHYLTLQSAFLNLLFSSEWGEKDLQGRDKWEKRGLCPGEGAGVVLLTSFGFWLWKKLVVEKLEICMFLQTGSSVFVLYSSGGGKPSQDGGKGVGGGTEKSHKSYLRAGKKCL